MTTFSREITPYPNFNIKILAYLHFKYFYTISMLGIYANTEDYDEKWYAKGGLLWKGTEPPVLFNYNHSYYKEIKAFLSAIAYTD